MEKAKPTIEIDQTRIKEKAARYISYQKKLARITEKMKKGGKRS